MVIDVRRCWAPKPMRSLWQAMLAREYTYAYAADVATRQMDSLILPKVNTSCMQRLQSFQSSLGTGSIDHRETLD